MVQSVSKGPGEVGRTLGRSLGHLDKVLFDVGHLDVKRRTRHSRYARQTGLEISGCDGDRLRARLRDAGHPALELIQPRAQTLAVLDGPGGALLVLGLHRSYALLAQLALRFGLCASSDELLGLGGGEVGDDGGDAGLEVNESGLLGVDQSGERGIGVGQASDLMEEQPRRRS